MPLQTYFKYLILLQPLDNRINFYEIFNLKLKIINS